MSKSHPTHRWCVSDVGAPFCSCCMLRLWDLFHDITIEAKEPCRGWFFPPKPFAVTRPELGGDK